MLMLRFEPYTKVNVSALLLFADPAHTQTLGILLLVNSCLLLK